MVKKIKGDIGNKYHIILTYFGTIFGPANKGEMTTEEHNAEILVKLANDNCAHQEPEPIQALRKNSLVKPRGTTLYHDIIELMDAYSRHGCPAACWEYWKVAHIENFLK